MDAKTFLEWWPVWTQTLAWIIIGAVAWTRMIDKVNGQGGRITSVDGRVSKLEGTVDRHDKELLEYRRDTQEINRGMGRVEKGQVDMLEAVNQGNLQIGAQIHQLEKVVQEKDLKTQLRLRTIEVVNRIEDKIGPLPTD